MITTISITRQWQIYIPEKVRAKLGLKKPGKATVEVRGKKLIITPKESEVLKLAGKYKHLYKKDPIDIDNVRDYIDYSKA